MSWTLAIDFGTTCTAAAVRDDHKGVVRPVALDGDATTMPSTVCLGDGRTLLAGRAAVNAAAQFPERAELNPKGVLGRADQVRLGGQSFDPADLAATALGEAYRAACRSQVGAPTTVFLTHPARWGERELGALRAAAGKAGVSTEVRLVAEPVAVGQFYFTSRSARVGSFVAVYDLGGGTFDTAVLRRTDEGFEVVGEPGGDAHLGGADFDDVMRELVRLRAEELDPDRWNTLETTEDAEGRRAQMLLRRDLTEARERLSTEDSASIYVPGYAQEFTVTRAEFEAAAKTLVDESVRILEATITRSGLPDADLAAVYLSGGASRTPLVQARITRRVLLAAEPKLVVARGALVEPRPQAAPVLSAAPVTPTPEPVAHLASFTSTSSTSSSASLPSPSTSVSDREVYIWMAIVGFCVIMFFVTLLS